MNVIILGDPHLGKSSKIGQSTLGSAINSRVHDQFIILEWVLDKAIENLSNRIIITGDVFDDPSPNIRLIEMFLDWVQKCTDQEIYVDIIIGNHDILRIGSVIHTSLDIIEKCNNPYINIHKEIDTVYDNNTAFTFIPFSDRKTYSAETTGIAIDFISQALSYERLSIPNEYTTVAIGHLAIEGCIPIGDELDSITNELMCPVSMFSEYDYTWMGHVHNPQVVKKYPYTAHIGSMDISNFGDADETKKIIIFDTINCTFKELPVPVRRLTLLSYTIPSGTTDTTKYVLDQLSLVDIKNHIVRIEVTITDISSISLKRESIINALKAKGVFLISGIIESKKIDMIRKSSATRNISDVEMKKADVPAAIKMWAESVIDASERDDFLTVASEVVESVK